MKNINSTLEKIRADHKSRMDEGWITINGTHVMVDKEGNLSGKIGEKISGTSKGKTSSSGGKNSSSGSSDKKSSSDTFTSDKKGAPSASEIGFDENEYKKAEREWHEKNTGYFGSGKQQEVVDKITENLPKHVKTGNCDYEIDHYDYVGGHFSYKGTADGYTVGKEYEIPGKDGVIGKAVSIHVYPDGDGEVHFNYKDFGIRGNYTHHF